MSTMLEIETEKRPRIYIRGSEMTYGLDLASTMPIEKIRRDVRPPARWQLPAGLLGAIAFITCLAWTSNCLANPTQEEVFKSISSNVGNDNATGSGVFLAVIITIVAVLLAAVVWKNRTAAPAGGVAPLNNQGKLVKELMKATGLKHGQLRQLRVLADDLETRGQRVESPLTLLLCPSLLRKAKGEK